MIFDDHYEVFLADTKESKNLHYRLRYVVYHEETGWERGHEVIRTRLEHDKFDSFSRHFIVRDKCTHEWVGGMRVIIMPFSKLPVTRLCRLSDSVDKSFMRHCLEISRLFVLPDYRCGSSRKKGRDRNDAQKCERNDAGIYFEIMLGLIRAAREYGYQKGLNNWFFLIEPSLARSIRGLGMNLDECGGGVEHNGLRRPYYSDITTSFNRLLCRGDDVSAMFLKEKTYQLISEIDTIQSEPSLLYEKSVQSPAFYSSEDCFKFSSKI